MAESTSTGAGQVDLLVEELVVRYGTATAVDGVSLEIRRGQITSVIGSNGAGKSTLLRAIVGGVRAQAGVVRFRGDDLTTRLTNEIVNLGVALVPEGRRLFREMSVMENLLLGAYRHKGRNDVKTDLDQVFSYFPILKEKSAERARHLSGGQQQMLAIGRALMSRPQLLMMDEPCAGLAPVMVKQIAGLFQHICNDGVTVLLVEQNAVVALDVSDHCYVLETGKVALSGPSKDLMETDYVTRAYLGM